MVECYGKSIKYSLHLANSIIFLSGALVLALGIWTVSDRSFMERLLGIHLYVVSSVLLIVTGAIVAFIALLGSLGAYKEIKIMLKSYFVILLTLLSMLLAVATSCFVFRDQLDKWLQTEMLSSMKSYGSDAHVTEAWDSIQISFECCGVAMANSTGRGLDSWRIESSSFNGSDTSPIVPLSCCRSREDDQIRRACQGRNPRKEDTYTDGCYDKMKSAIKDHMVPIGVASVFAVAIVLFGLILSVALYFIIGRKSSQKLSDSSSGIGIGSE